jgi:hypothetical protein
MQVHTSYTKEDQNGNYTYIAPALTNAATWIAGLTVKRLTPHWAAFKPPLPANAGPYRQAYVEVVGCASASFCVAAGRYQDSSNIWQGLLLTWTGSVWIAAEAPLPPDATTADTYFTAVACPSTSACVITGQYNLASGAQQGVLLWGSVSRDIGTSLWADS